MAVSAMPAADTLTRLLLAARDADWGDWSDRAVRSAAAVQGWRTGSPDAAGAADLDPAVPGLTGRWTPATDSDPCPLLRLSATLPDRGADPQPGPPPAYGMGFGGAPAAGPWGTPSGYGYRYERDRGREIDAAHTRLVAALTSALGPAPWRGGPGAWLRWRNPQLTLRISRDREPGRLVMDLFPTVPAELRDQDLFADAGGLAGLPYTWCVSRPDLALAELFLPFGPDPRDWDEFAAGLPQLLQALLTEMPLVGWVEPVLLVIGSVGDMSRSVELRIGQDRLELGGVPGSGRHVWLRPGADHGRTAAALMLDAFASWGVGDARKLRLRCFTSGGYIDLPGVGVRPEGTHPDDLQGR